MRHFLVSSSLAAALLASPLAQAQDPTFTVTMLSQETALKGAQAALKSCSAAGYRVAVSIVDRSGIEQVMLRDSLAGPHTPNTAKGKAWTAASFRTATTMMADLLKKGTMPAAIGNLPGVIAAGGGLRIEVGGTVVGGIGVSGAPGGHLDDKCAQVGLDAIAEETF